VGTGTKWETEKRPKGEIGKSKGNVFLEKKGWKVTGEGNGNKVVASVAGKKKGGVETET